MKLSGIVILGLLVIATQFSFAQTPNIVILNADVRTMDKLKPKAEAVAITKNKISAVGTNFIIKQLAGADTKVIDAGGKLVIPGFNDSHVHFFSIGAGFFSLNLRNVKTSDDLTNLIKFHARFLPFDQWIVGNFQKWTDSPLPSKRAIDLVSPNHPVLIYLQGSRLAFANSFALKLAGIESLDGIIRDSSVLRVKNKIPVTSFGTSPIFAEIATNYAASVGVTSVQDVHSDDSYEILRGLQREGKLKTRVYECIGLREWKKLANHGVKRATGDSMIRQGCLKYFSEGDKDEIPDLLKPTIGADKADLQVMIHAIGREANNVVLTVYERVMRQNGAKDRRFRIEHAHDFRPNDLKRFVLTKTIASMQPALFFDGKDQKIFRQILDSGALIAFGSDANIIDLNPLAGVYAAVFGNGISVEEAVRAYTLNAAYAEFQEDVKGSITAGKLADLVILSDNLFTIETEKIPHVKVLMTIMDGKIVYQAENED